MTDQEFEALVSRLQRASAAHPVLYRVRVLLLAALGYAFLVGSVIALGVATIAIVIVLAGLRVAVFARRLAGPLATLMAMVLRALWVRIPTPTGVPVMAERAPRLFALLERVRKQVDGPRIHRVLMDGTFNASIVQVPRLGVFGWQKNYLVVGLPLMHLIPTPEFEAVIAHEMGHLVGAHGRFSIWVYRQRQSWLQLLQQLEAEKKLEGSVFLDFSRWYAPLFNAYTFVMARAHEYDADRLSAKVSSPRVAADALARIEVGGRWVSQDFWPDIQRRVRAAALPPADVFNEMARRGREPAEADRVSARLTEALGAETGSMDTHPSFKARLEALGESPRPPVPFHASAAQEVLGRDLLDLEGQLDRSWHDSVVDHWKQENAQAVAQQKRLAELDAKEATGPLSTEERWARACLLSAEERMQESEALVENLVATAPTFAPSQSVWGIILLHRGDEQGLGHIDRALELGGIDPVDPCRAAYVYLVSHNRTAEAERYANRVREHQAMLAAAREERATFTEHDSVEPHGLTESQLEALRQALKAFPEVRSAALARKKVKHFPDSPVFVLGVYIRKKFWRRRSTQAVEVRKALLTGVPLADEWFCWSLDLVSRKRRKQFEEAAGGPFYRAP